jgi:hypothetical protein
MTTTHQEVSDLHFGAFDLVDRPHPGTGPSLNSS